MLYDAVERTFAPVIHDGAMMDFVRGRAISRERESGHDDGNYTIEAILRLAESVDPALRDRWRGLCAGWIARDTYSDVLVSGGLPRMALVKNLMASGVPPALEPNGHTLFASMDRAVHRRDGWAYAIAMSSERITWYECGNGENNRSYFTGSGMTYLYDGDSGQWDDKFWPTVDLTRLPGTAVDTTALPDRVEGEWASSAPATSWVGGATLDGSATIGQHVAGPGGTGLNARKSWFCVDDLVVALGSDIHSTSGNPIETIVENRSLHSTGEQVVTVDGAAHVPTLGNQTRIAGASWAHLEGVAGYPFPARADLTVLREERTGAWRDNNAEGPTDPLTNRYVTMVLDHGAATTGATYAYVVVPGASLERTAALSKRPPFKVMTNTATVQAVAFPELDLLAINFWTAGTFGDITVDQPAALIVRQTHQALDVAVSDPTQKTTSIRVQIARSGWGKAATDPTVTMTQPRRNQVKFSVATMGSAGASHRVHLIR